MSLVNCLFVGGGGYLVYLLGVLRVKSLSGRARPSSRLPFYGIYLVLLTGLAWGGSFCFSTLLSFQEIYVVPPISLRLFVTGMGTLLGFLHGWPSMQPSVAALRRVDTLVKRGLWGMALFSVLVTFAILFSMIFESLRFFQHTSLVDFLFKTEWLPYSVPGETKGLFGALPLFTGTLLITGIAMAVAIPLGLFTAIYGVYYASPWVRTLMKPLLGVLAGIPTVVYGFLAVFFISPFLSFIARGGGIDLPSESALGAGLVMGIMILPTLASLGDEVLSSLPHSLKEGSLGMGATLSETIKYVLLPAAAPGLLAVALLGVSRAVGETMLVVMAVGLMAQVSFNPLDTVTTVTVQIVSLLTGDQSFDSPAPLSAFALGLVLFFFTLGLNMLALTVVRRYRQKYDF